MTLQRTRVSIDARTILMPGITASIPKEAVQHPHQAKHPAYCGIAAQALPAEHQIYAESLARHEGREEDQDGSADVEGDLEQRDLAEDLERGEFCERTGSRRSTASRRHVVREVVQRDLMLS